MAGILVQKLNRNLSAKFFIVFIFTAVSVFVVYKALYVPDCAAFNEGDDRRHTVPSLALSREMLKDGDIPLMNFYNNFGTPLMADTFALPFAPQALTYVFFDGPTALTINRFLAALGTLFMLYLFFRSYFDRIISAILPILILWIPGFFQALAHHQFQMSLFFFSAALILIQRYSDKKINSFWFVLLLSLNIFVFFLGVNINSVAISFLFLLIAAFILGGDRFKAALLGVFGAFLAAVVATQFQTVAFFQNLSSSWRVGVSLAQPISQKFNALYTFLSLITQMRTLDGPYAYTTNFWLYFSFPFIVGAVFGAWLMWKIKISTRLIFLVLFLGFVPLLSVIFLYIFPFIWNHLPLIKSTDITRVLWYAGIFLALGVGYFIKELSSLRISQKIILVIAGITGLFLVFSFYCSSSLFFWINCDIKREYNIVAAVYGAVIFLGLLINYLFSIKGYFGVCDPKKTEKIFKFWLLPVLLLALLPAPYLLLDLKNPSACSGYYFTAMQRTEFEPLALLGKMEPYHRLATIRDSGEGHDLIAVKNHVLGSNALSIFNDRLFAEYLLGQQLVIIDEGRGGYHFLIPKDKSHSLALERLGIRYLLVSEESSRLETFGWKLIGEAEGYKLGYYILRQKKKNFYLYENSKKPTPFYIESGDNKDVGINFVRSYSFNGNTAVISLVTPPKEGDYLVATFVDRPGWVVGINGKKAQYESLEDRFIRIPLNTESKTITLSYSPYSWRYVAVSLLLAIGLLFVFVLLAKRLEKS